MGPFNKKQNCISFYNLASGRWLLRQPPPPLRSQSHDLPADLETKPQAKPQCDWLPSDLAASTPRKYLDVSNWKVKVGSSKLDHVSSLSVAKIFVTKENALNSREKDIALVKLQVPLTFTGERWSLGAEPLKLSSPHPAKQAALDTSCSF